MITFKDSKFVNKLIGLYLKLLNLYFINQNFVFEIHS